MVYISCHQRPSSSNRSCTLFFYAALELLHFTDIPVKFATIRVVFDALKQKEMELTLVSLFVCFIDRKLSSMDPP